MKKAKYVAAIVPVLKEDGLKVSMDKVAIKIGATKKTLYNQFVTKELMIEECLEEMTRQYRESLDCMDDPAISIPERLEAGINTLRQYFRDMSHAFMGDLVTFYPQKATADHVQGSSFFEKKLADNIEAGKAAGVYRENIDSTLLAKYISYAVFSFFKKEVMNGHSYSADYYFQQIIDFNINALLVK